MKLTVFLSFVVVFQLYASVSFAQNDKISINGNQVALQNILDQIEKQSEFSFLYNRDVVNLNRRINVSLDDLSIEEVLSKVLEGTNVNYRIIDKQIVLTPNFTAHNHASQQDKIIVRGVVTDNTGEPLPGVNVFEKENPTNGVITGIDGSYTIEMKDPDVVLVFSFIGFDVTQINVAGKEKINITLIEEVTGLDEVVVTALGISREKKSLGYSVQDVEGEEIVESKELDVVNSLAGKIS
ncbi:MAG: carboxypeptidase-like regulatory domain-containing protein, partial [Marinilabiliaceae bacterium]|nr:carboxypeptidase-like regulatory domain-containing protein [Marinilabiliaceae bacterium]